jgi:hypothetical protein
VLLAGCITLFVSKNGMIISSILAAGQSLELDINGCTRTVMVKSKELIL